MSRFYKITGIVLLFLSVVDIDSSSREGSRIGLGIAGGLCLLGAALIESRQTGGRSG